MNHEAKLNVALITGGSSGIGLAIARELARRSYSLLLVSNQPEALTSVKKEMEENEGVSCYVLDIDLTQNHAVQQIEDFVNRNNLAVDILVNNAGIMVFSEVANTPVEILVAILKLHVHVPTQLCSLFGAAMKQNKFGYILNVSSISAVMPYPGISLYGPTKTYMRYFSRALRSEMKEYHVKVTCLMPGATATALFDAEKVNMVLAKRLGIMHSAEFVAAKAVSALFRNKSEFIPGILNKVIMFLLPLVPTFIIELINHNTNYLEKR
jgi:short-subunit dehydrogenase